jgi:hypothetical protein
MGTHLPGLCFPQFRKELSKISLGPIENVIETLLRCNRQPNTFNIDVTDFVAVTRRGKPPFDLLAPAAILFNLTYNDYKIAVLGCGNNFQVGTFEIIRIADKQSRRIIVEQRVKFILVARRQHLLIWAKRNIGDGTEIDVSVQDGNELIAQRRATGPGVCQRHDFIGNTERFFRDYSRLKAKLEVLRVFPATLSTTV